MSQEKCDFMTKRAIMKSRFKSENYKGRWFVLTTTDLAYYDGSIDNGRGKMKGSPILLRNVKVIEEVGPEHLANKPNAFQVVYSDETSGELYTLYIIALTAEKRSEWIQALRKMCRRNGSDFFSRYHPGVYSFRARRWTCCEQIFQQAEGCESVPEQSNGVSDPFLSNRTLPRGESEEEKPKPTTARNNRDRPVPPVPPQSSVKPAEDIVLALYDYQKVEPDDLSLVKGEEYEILEKDTQFWWKAKDKQGGIGFIPANYVQKAESDNLQQYDWYYPNITRTQSELILKREAKDGCFLVRESSAKGMCTLSIFAKEGGEGVVKHYHIKKKGNGDFYLTERHAYNSIPILINYHKHNCAGLIVRLRSSPSSGKETLTPTTSGLGHDRYEIDPSELVMQEDLGQGQFGTVKLAMWKNSKQVAVKMMKEGAMTEEDFIDEAKTMQELQHKNLVQLYGVSTLKKPIYIITEYMKHGSLQSYMRRHKNRLLRKVATLLDMCVQVSEAMEYLESQKFIHRDLAARNCLVGENEVVKVGDFGLARFVLDDEYTSSQGTKFPIRWAPPEVLSYTRFSSKSDVWSYGVLMWEIFTCGDLPYGRVKNQDVVSQVCHQNKRLDRPPRCPEDVYDVMLTAWRENPDQRPEFSQIHENLADIQNTLTEYAD